MTMKQPPDMVHDQDAGRDKQIQVWGNADDPRFRLTIYEPQRGGKKIGGVGGLPFLDYVGEYAGLGPAHYALEVGSGMGDACEYVASRFGCRVTGVEMGTRQIERARQRHAGSRSRGVEFIQADMLLWEPPRPCDVVFFFELLPIVENRPEWLERIRGWLRPGGALTMTDIVAGPDLSNEQRAFLWQEDGIFENLPLQAESLAMIRDAGFRELDVTDITHAGVTQNERILKESHRHKNAIVNEVGLESWQNWVECAKVYGQMFVERKLVCLRIGCRTGAE